MLLSSERTDEVSEGEGDVAREVFDRADMEG